jgi:hypothetical protein
MGRIGPAKAYRPLLVRDGPGGHVRLVVVGQISAREPTSHWLWVMFRPGSKPAKTFSTRCLTLKVTV